MAVKYGSVPEVGPDPNPRWSMPSPAALGIERPDPQADLARLLREISDDMTAVERKLIEAVSLLSRLGAWNEVVRLLVGVGGYQLAEIAEAVGVMRSTVTRWYNGETTPPPDQITRYAERLIAHMRSSRKIALQVDPKSLVDDGSRQ